MINRLSFVAVFSFLLVLFSVTLSYGADFESNSSDTLVFPYERKTFIEGEKSVSYRLRNATQDTPYLIQGSMENLDQTTGVNTLEKNNDVPFMITPPLHKLEPGQRYHWRVMFIGDTTKIAKDRETVYIAKFRTIPPSTPMSSDKKNDTQFTAIQALHFKVYYRPKSLENLQLIDEQKKVSFKLVGNEVVVTNHSPIYMTFDSLTVGGVEVDSNELFKPLTPLSEQRFTLKGNVKGNQVTWSILDELVLPLPKQTASLQ